MPTESKAEVEIKPATEQGPTNAPLPPPFTFDGRRARAEKSREEIDYLDQLLQNRTEASPTERGRFDPRKRLKALGRVMLVKAGAGAQRGEAIARRARLYTERKLQEHHSYHPEHRAAEHVHILHGTEEDKLHPPEHRSPPEVQQKLQTAKALGAAGVARLVYQRSKDYAGRANVYLQQQLEVTRNYFADTERDGERKNRRIGGAMLVLAGVAGLVLATRYGIDLPFWEKEPHPPRPDIDGPPDGVREGGRGEREPPRDNKPPFEPPPEFADSAGNLSTGQNPWSEGEDYVRALGYDLNPNNQQDLMTLDAIKDRVLVLNDFPDPTRLPVGTRVNLPPPEVIDQLYRQYH